MTLDIRDPRLLDIVDEDSPLLTIAEDFRFTEGPIWHPREHHLTFSDIPANKLYRWSDADGLRVYREPSQLTNGNTYDREGRILSCEHATSRVVREEQGELVVLASHWQGKELNSPNDIVVRNDGTIYFTDPLYGRGSHTGIERDPELDFQGVYRFDPANDELCLLGSDFEAPNGLCFGLDHETLFVADTARRHIRRFRIRGNSLEGGEVFGQSPAPDGLKIDAEGHLYAGGPGGVHVHHRDDGTLLGVIATGSFCANFAWGGDDLRTLFMTSSRGLYRLRVKTPGIALF
jgi:gluconolactonase